MEAGLLELLFDIDFAFLHERQQIAAHPGDFGEGEAVLGEIDGLSGEVGRGGVAFGGSGVAVGTEEAMLKLHSADGGVDLQRGVEAGVVRAGQIVEELSGPRTAVAAVGWEALVDDEGGADGNGDQHVLLPHEVNVVVVLDAIEAFAVGNLILAEQNLVRALERWGNDEAAALVVERGKNCRSGGYFFDRG